jgi:uncharacterized SAM-binding protein YcdF (DUF218 family)
MRRLTKPALVWVIPILFGLIVIWLSMLAYTIYSYSHYTSNSSADAAIVLGAAIWGNQPSPVFRERINHAIDLYQSGVVNYLVFTGGQGKGQKYAEAEVAKTYAIQQGVPENRIITETVSKTTYENLVQAQKILQLHGILTTLIVSDPLHMKRAMAIAQGLKLTANPSPTPTTRLRTSQRKIKFIIRETIFYAGYLLGIVR